MNAISAIVTLVSVIVIAACGLVLVVVAHDPAGFILLLVAVGICGIVAAVSASTESGAPVESSPPLCEPRLTPPRRPRVAGRHHPKRKP